MDLLKPLQSCLVGAGNNHRLAQVYRLLPKLSGLLWIATVITAVVFSVTSSTDPARPGKPAKTAPIKR